MDKTVTLQRKVLAAVMYSALSIGGGYSARYLAPEQPRTVYSDTQRMSANEEHLRLIEKKVDQLTITVSGLDDRISFLEYRIRLLERKQKE